MIMKAILLLLFVTATASAEPVRLLDMGFDKKPPQ
jgi:hypothetical protein